MNILKITWRDSCRGDGVTWQDAEELADFMEKYGDYQICSVGFLYEETDNYLYILQSVDNQINTRYDGVLEIPKNAIINITTLEKKEEEEEDLEDSG